MEQLGEAGAGFRSLTEAIDTTTPASRMMMQMVGAFAEFERAMLRERTQAGVDAARQQGRVGGRRPKLFPQQQSEIRKMVSEGDKTAAAAARLFKVHPATVSRLLERDALHGQRIGYVRVSSFGQVAENANSSMSRFEKPPSQGVWGRRRRRRLQ